MASNLDRLALAYAHTPLGVILRDVCSDVERLEARIVALEKILQELADRSGEA